MRKNVILLLLCSLMPLYATSAEPRMKPGLWEMTMKSDAMKNMPKISPEQMEQMRKMGVNVPQMQDGAMVTKVCITKQMAESNQAPGMEKNDTGCQTRNMQQSGSNYSADIICNSADMKGEGTAKGSFAGDRSFTSTFEFKGTVHGNPITQRQETSGKWLAADCGAVQPMGDARPKK